MPLFWIIHEHEGSRYVYIREASTLLYARLYGAMDKSLSGTFVEAHALDEKFARKIGKRSRNKMLTLDAARKLLERMPR